MPRRFQYRIAEDESCVLQQFEEVCGEFRGVRVSENREKIIVTIRLTRSIILPMQKDLLSQLKQMKVGQSIAVLRSDDAMLTFRSL